MPNEVSVNASTIAAISSLQHLSGLAVNKVPIVMSRRAAQRGIRAHEGSAVLPTRSG